MATNSSVHTPTPFAAVGPAGRRGGMLAWCVLAAVCLALYANALPNEFLFDDPFIIRDDERVTKMQIGRLLTEPYWPGIAFDDKLYRPVVSISYALNWAVSHEPWAFRLPNLLIHAMVCGMVFTLTRDVFRNTRAAWIAALLFAIHPIHTEPLNTIVGRADLAVTAFGLAALLLWWRDAETPRGSIRRPVLAALCFACGLLCKESAVTFIGLAVLLDWWRWQQGGLSGRRWVLRRVIRCYAPTLLVLVAYLLVRYEVLNTLTNTKVIYRPDNPIATPADWLTPGDSPFLIRWATPAYTLAKAAAMMICPAPLLHDYAYPAIREVRRMNDPRLWYGAACLAGLVLICLVSLRRRRQALMAVGFALIPYSIVSNFVVLIGTIFGERLLYTPSVGFCMAVGLAAAQTSKRRNVETSKHEAVLPDSGGAPPRAALSESRSFRRGAMLVLGLWAGWLCLLVVRRNADWRDVHALVASVSDNERTSFKVLGAFSDRALLRAAGHEAAGRREEEQAEYRKALEFGMRAKKAAPDAWGGYKNIGRARNRMGRYDPQQYPMAMAVFRKALDLGAGVDPDVLRESSDLYMRFGEYLAAAQILEQRVKRDKTPEVQNMFDAALRGAQRLLDDPATAPKDGKTYLTIAGMLKGAGRMEEAVSVVQKGLARCPADDPSRAELERMQKELGP